ncbi:methionine ABC transporter ATP-binding protein [Bacillus coahuilensis]|uniref:methionine ABC transporter ATP-binding protein n=1 Tax=Bacillus coahuilensis TaxID=408580 RepID=UPI0001850916|nr:ATP-binding cassette domain-containing protein [Bacillus coahuilensis]
MIHFQHVSKEYQKIEVSVKAVDEVDLLIQKGEIFGIIGFSGAGKSTLIRLVNLLEKPTSGKVTVAGKNMTDLSNAELRNARRKIGMIFQHFNLLESKTVFQNVAFPLKLTGVNQEEKETRVRELLEFIGLSHKANDYPSQLSGGQKQRVGIARALATSPEILLCDEATSALDPETTSSILALLKRVRDQYGVTILMITHEMNVIREVCDRVAVMEEGRVIESGSVFDIFSQPGHNTTKNFVKTVMQDVTPPSILQQLEGEGRLNNLYQFIFQRDSAGQPVLSRLSKEFQIEVNILYGQITELQGIPFGRLLVELRGESREIEEAVRYVQGFVEVKEVASIAS